MKYKLIVSDLDDTLLDDNLGYSAGLVQAISRYVDAGGRFTVATGRMTEPMLDVCRELGLKGEAISYQGAVICDIESGNIINEVIIPNDTAVRVCRYLDNLGIYYQVYKDGYIHIKTRTPYSDRYAKLCRCPFVEHKEGLHTFVRDSGIAPIKILLIDEPPRIEPLIAELNGLFGKELLINTSKKWLIEMVNSQTDKGRAVAHLAQKHGIKQQEVICIGDSLNDLSMIQYAGLGVCVANAADSLKRHAKYICPSNNDGGVAFVINKFGLEE